METLIYYFSFPFVRYALIAGVLISLCSSLLGVTLVLKRFSFIGDGLSHVAFGAMAIASVMGLTNDLWLGKLTDKIFGSLFDADKREAIVGLINQAFIILLTVGCAIILLKTGQNTKINGDAQIAMISVGALALGYLLMSIFPTSSNVAADVCTTLFGSFKILTLKGYEVWICVILSIVVVTLFILFYNKIFAVTFDENFAKATGTNANKYNVLIAVIIAVVIVVAMNLVGSLLISALIVFPALSAMRVFKNFKAVTICSAIISVSCATVGILISILLSTPVGPTIVMIDVVVFFAFWLTGAIRGRVAK